MSMVCVYALGGNTGTSQHCCLLCVIHNSVGSALLVPTVMGIPEPRSVERVTVQFLRFFCCVNAIAGAGGVCSLYIMKLCRKFMLGT